MSEIRDLIQQLIASGVDPVEAGEVVARAAVAGASTTTRSAHAVRQERYRARQNDKSKRLPDKEWYPLVGKVIARDGGKCAYCGSQDKLGADHVLPLSRGGTNDEANLVACCESCNKSKGGRTVEEWRDGAGPRHGSVTVTGNDANADDASLPSKETPQTPKETQPTLPTTPKEKTPKGVQKKAVRLPEDWQLPPEWRRDAIEQGLHPQRVDAEAAKMRDWSRSSPNGAKLDWRASWRNWCRGAVEKQAPQGRGPPQRPVESLIDSLVADMDYADANTTTETEGYPAAPLRLPAH